MASVSASKLSTSFTLGQGLRWLVTLGALSWGLVINSYVGLFVLCRDCIRPLEFANHIAHWISLSAVVVFVMSVLIVRKWWLAGWLLPGVLMFSLAFGRLWLPSPTPDVDGIEVSAATYNVLGHLAEPQETLAVITAMDADFVAIQELRPTLRYYLQNDLGEVYPYQSSHIVQGVDGLGLLSKYPFIGEPEFNIPRNYQTTQPRYARAIVNVEEQPLVIYVYHPNTPYFEPSSINIEQTRRLMELVAAEQDPVLLLCDCNNTSLSETYSLIDAHLNDSFAAQGFGFGLTFPAGGYNWGETNAPDFIKPLIRIDYIWHSSALVTLEAKVWRDGDGGTSDHFPVWGRLVLKTE